MSSKTNNSPAKRSKRAKAQPVEAQPVEAQPVEAQPVHHMPICDVKSKRAILQPVHVATIPDVLIKTRVATRRNNVIETIRAYADTAQPLTCNEIKLLFGTQRGGLRTVAKYLRKAQLLADGRIIGNPEAKEQPNGDVEMLNRVLANGLQWAITENAAKPVQLRGKI